jgi:hypothetical protein
MAIRKRLATKPKAATKKAPAKPVQSKQERLVAMLRQPGGATVAQMAKAFGWEPHTVRGAISGTLKKKLGLKIASAKPAEGERVYRIA